VISPFAILVDLSWLQVDHQVIECTFRLPMVSAKQQYDDGGTIDNTVLIIKHQTKIRVHLFVCQEESDEFDISDYHWARKETDKQQDLALASNHFHNAGFVPQQTHL